MAQMAECATTFEHHYAVYCMVFHEVAAKYANFPLIDISDLSKVLYAIGIYEEKKATGLGESVIKRMREIVGHPHQILLNRVKFAEVLMMVVEADNKNTPGYELNLYLRPIFDTYFVPFLTNKEPESLPVSLDAFRNRFVWKENTNSLLEHNLEGIMDVFSRF